MCLLYHSVYRVQLLLPPSLDGANRKKNEHQNYICIMAENKNSTFEIGSVFFFKSRIPILSHTLYVYVFNIFRLFELRAVRVECVSVKFMVVKL